MQHGLALIREVAGAWVVPHLRSEFVYELPSGELRTALIRPYRPVADLGPESAYRAPHPTEIGGELIPARILREYGLTMVES